MTELLILAYGGTAYLLFLASFLYSIAFVGNLPVPLTVDAGAAGPAGRAVLVDVLLLAAFAVQHSVMARTAFKRAAARVIPAAIERSTYVLAASLVLAAVMAFWRPIAQPAIWEVRDPWAVLVLEAVFWAGWVLMVASSFLLNHFEMFGLQQVAARAFRLDIAAPHFRTPLLYRRVRHPIYLGLLLGFWATPRMSAGHLLFATVMTGYIFVGIWFEERDLVTHFGDRYREYQRRVGMVLPRRSR